MASSEYLKWVSLPSDVTVSILRRLEANEILKSVQWVCVTWHKLCKEPSTWRSIDMYNFLDTPSYLTEIMFRDAVDRSCGYLYNVTLCSFCSVKLLRYVVHRAPLLRSLHLSFCYNLYPEDLAEVAKKVPNLEELHIFSTTVSKEVIESFGHCCTQLKSLTYDTVDDEGDGVALAIAQTMPGLRHLRLCKNKMTNVGLQAILNQCPHIESLDIRRCSNVNLEGAFGRACAERIKILILPNDPIDGFKSKRIVNDECWYDSSDDEISTISDSSSSYEYNSYEDELSTSSSPREKPLSPPPSWLDLPGEATKAIMQRLGAINILEVAQKVCMTWRVICKRPSMWRSIDMHNLGDLHDMLYDLNKMCRHAIDRSCGGLSYINLEYFANVDLLDYIAKRAPQLRSLRLACCYDLYDEELCEVAKKLSNLEELHMFLSDVPKEALESFGLCCPQLTSLTYNIQGVRFPSPDDDSDVEDLAIAHTMPRLRHLSLFGNQMTNYGLQAILNQCSYLESLDLRQCFNVNLEGDFGRTCAQRIKNLKRPNDSTEDYDYDATVCSFDD